jgi:hypothetical protein
MVGRGTQYAVRSMRCAMSSAQYAVRSMRCAISSAQCADRPLSTVPRLIFVIPAKAGIQNASPEHTEPPHR